MSLFDALALVCGLCMVLKMPKRVYKALGLTLMGAVLWSSVLAPSVKTLRSHAKALVSVTAPTPWSQDEIQVLVATEAVLIDLDPTIALMFSELETNHKNVTGDQGRSHGPLQVMAKFHIPEGDPNDPRVSVRAGVGVIARKLAQYDGDIVKARLAYVCGSASGCSEWKRRNIVSRVERMAPGYGLTL